MDLKCKPCRYCVEEHGYQAPYVTLICQITRERFPLTKCLKEYENG